MTFEAMSDSGNMLKDPIGGKDVVIVDREKAKGLVPALTLGRMGSLPPSIASRIRLIPIRTAAGEGMLTGFSPDMAELDFGGEKKEIDVIVALSAEALSGSGCEAIVASDYFT